MISYKFSDVTPLPAPFKDDGELMAYLRLPDTHEGRAMAAQVTPERRAQYAAMRALERELQAGRVPRGVIACARSRGSHHG